MSDDITHTLRHQEDLAAMCEPGFGMGSLPYRLAREEIERLRALLDNIATRIVARSELYTNDADLLTDIVLLARTGGSTGYTSNAD